MKKLLYTLFFILTVNYSYSETIHVYDLDVDNYPSIQAKFFAIDNNGEQIFPNEDQLSVFESDRLVNNLSISCPTESRLRPLSAVLSVDISGSMLDSNALNWELANEAVNAWADLMTPDIETSVVGFNYLSFMFTDLTTDPDLVRNSISEIIPFGGTDFEISFLDPQSGSLTVAANGKHPEPVIILLSDGEANVRDEVVIKQAQDLGIRVFAVILNQECPELMKNITRETGGFYYDSVSTKAEINEIYKTLFSIAILDEPCTITWISSECELYREGYAELNDTEVRSSFNYSVQDSVLPSLRYQPDRYFVFSEVGFNSSGSRWVSVTAENSDVYIQDLIVDNDAYSIANLGGREFPFLLSKDETWSFQIRFDYTQEVFEFATFELVSNACLNSTFFAAGGKQGSVPKDNSMKIIEPNGGEIYLSGIDTLIKWEGTSNKDSIMIEFSTNNGEKWSLVTRSAQNLNYQYEIPNVTSEECKVRLTKFANDFGYEYLNINTDSVNVNDVDWQPEGTYIAVASNDNDLKIYNTSNGSTLTYLQGHTDILNAVSWAPDALRISSVSKDSTLKVWNAFARMEIYSVDLNEQALDIEWSPNGQFIAYGGENNTLYILNANDGSVFKEITDHTQDILTLSWNDTGTMLASAGSDSTIKVYETEQWNLINSFKAYRAPVSCIDFVGDDIASVSLQNETNEVIIWPIGFGEQPTRIPVNEQLRSVSAISDGDKKLITYTGESGRVYVYDCINKEEIYLFYKDIWVHTASSWSPDGNRFAVGLNGKLSGETVRFYSIDTFPILQAESDSTFAITRLNLIAENIDMGEIPLGRSVNISIEDYFTNNSLLPINITNFELLNDPFGHFSIDANISKAIPANSTLEAEFSYTPKKVGVHSSNILINASGKQLIYRITGNCVEPAIRDTIFDFGEQQLSKQVTEVIEITNNTGQDLQISESKLIGPELTDLELLQSPSKIENKETEIFIVRYTANKLGRVNSNIQIDHDGYGSPTIIRLFGKGISPSLEISEVEQLEVDCGDSDTLKIKVKNTGKGTLVLDQLTNFNPTFNLLNSDNININENDSTEIRLLFDPSLTSQLELDSLIINSNTQNEFDTVYYSALVLKSNIQILDGNLIDIEQKEENKVEDIDITILNNGVLQADLSSQIGVKTDDNKFEIISITPDLIESGENAIIKLRSVGGKFGDEFTSILNFSDACESNYSLRIESKIIEELASVETLSSSEFNVECEDRYTFDLEFRNNGKVDFDLSNAKTVNSLKVNFTPEKIIIDDSFIISIEVKGDKNNPIKYDTLIIENSNGFDPFRIPIEINTKYEDISIIENSIDFVIDNATGPFTNTFKVFNNSDVPKVWSPPYNFGDYVITDVVPLITPVDGVSEFTVYYYSMKTDTSYYPIVSLCSEDSIQFRVYSSYFPEFDLIINDENAYIGDIFPLEFTLRKESNLFENDYDGLRVFINYNSSLMKYENDPDAELLQDGRAYLQLDLMLDEYDQKWDSHNFKALWGNDSTTSIILDSLQLINSDDLVFYGRSDGTLRIIDLCEAGGTRLFKGGYFDLQINPNPASDNINIEIEILESAAHKMELIDADGKLVDVIFSGLTTPGRYTFSEDLANVPAGVHFLRLTTPSKVITKKIVVE